MDNRHGLAIDARLTQAGPRGEWEAALEIGRRTLLVHDAQMDEFLDMARIGRIVVRESCHIGMRSILLPNVEIGPRTFVWANSTVSRSLPPDTVCAGIPAKVVCSLDEYFSKHKERMRVRPQFEYSRYDIRVLLDAERCDEMKKALKKDDAYIIGGSTADLSEKGGTVRTPFNLDSE